MDVQKDILENAGVPAQDVQRLEAAWAAYQSAKNQPARDIPCIVCTGIYNAGKSTLLNALTGTEQFPTGDVPTTKAVAQAELDGAVYIDTPGLNAAEADDMETQAAYEVADFILFVSSAVSGGISQAEAQWLRTLRERYDLGQRLIFVLTKCGQVDPEELSGITEQFRQDLEQTVGAGEVIPVDSITYRKGVSEGKALLVEHSGIPALKELLAEKIAAADRLLTQAREEERNQRRREVVEQIKRCRTYCLDKTAKLSYQNQQEVEALFAEARKSITDNCEEVVYIGSTYVYVSKGETRIRRMGVTSPFSVEADAKKALNKYYGECMSEARSKLSDCMYTIEEKYGTTGIDSFYFKSCSTVNGILEKLLLELRKLDITVGKISEISMEPDHNALSRMIQRVRERSAEVEFYDGTGLFNTCYDVFGNRFRSEDIKKGHYKKTLFGEKWVEDVGTEIDMYSAMSDAADQVQKQMSWFEKSVTGYIRDILRPFLNKLKAEANKCLEEMRRNAESSMTSATKCAGKPYQIALAHLDTLKKEVRP